jgi:hypothetical protein
MILKNRNFKFDFLQVLFFIILLNTYKNINNTQILE